MAITSVARKATIRKDDTLLKTAQIVGAQKLAGEKLRLQGEKQAADAAEKNRKVHTDYLKRIDTAAVNENPLYVEAYNAEKKAMFETIYDPSATGDEKDKAISDIDVNTEARNLHHNTNRELISDIVGTIDQRRTRDVEAVRNSISEQYVDDQGNMVDVTSLSPNDVAEAVANDIRTYKGAEISKDFAGAVQDIVETLTTTSQLAGGRLTQVQNAQKALDFGVLDANGKLMFDDDGNPLIKITPENLNMWKEFSPYNRLSLEEWKKDNPEGKGVEGMEAILKKDGQLTVRENIDKSEKTNPKDSSDTSGALRIENEDKRFEFLFSNNNAVDGGQIMAIVRRQKGVVASGEVFDNPHDPEDATTHTTGVKAIKGKDKNGKVIEVAKEYTFVVEKSRAVEIAGQIAGEGGVLSTMPMIVDTQKKDKFGVFTIRVDADNPMLGLQQLNVLYDKLTVSKNRVEFTGLDDAYKRYLKNQEDELNANPFGVVLK